MTGIAGVIGYKWAGLFSAFPSTLFPLLLIIHYTYGVDSVRSIIQNVPRGQFSMIIFGLCVYFSFPIFNVYIGTILSYSFVLAYLYIVTKYKLF